MTRLDVEARQTAINDEFKDYAADRKGLIEKIAAKVEDVGPTRAANTEERIANAIHATVAEGVFLEGTNGADDKAPINFLELGMRASRAVCHIVDGNRASLGTGFLVAPGLLLTNNHVIPTAADAEGAMAEFQLELDADENPVRPRRFLLEPSKLFATSPRGGLDFTFVAVAPVGLGGEALDAQGWLPMDERPNKILEGQPIVIIQHPNGQMKAICLFNSVLVLRDKEPDHPFIVYTTDTASGTSGSPCFNRFWQVVGLHHASIMSGEEHNGKPVILNRGIRISSIFNALKNGPMDGLLEGDAAHVAAIDQRLRDPLNRRNGRPFATDKAPAVAAVAASRTVITEEGSKGTVIRRKAPAHFDERRGFDPMFLTEKPGTDFDSEHPLFVPLPVLPIWLAEDVARLTGSQTDYELKYQLFSIAMSASRSLAIYTACNVDGSRMYKLDRDDRDPEDFLEPNVRPEAAADVWFFDPRISETYQLGPELYDSTDFDYGHLVRRLDPVWGPDDRTPRIANDDTFCMTNCSPQEVRFHRKRKAGEDSSNWSALENVILDEVNLKNRRAVILTGPVLDPRDVTILGVRIPTGFWKIVAYDDEGALKAHGFMLWQTSEVADLDEKFEGTAIDLGEARKPVRIRDISRLTSLDFGPLFGADVRG